MACAWGWRNKGSIVTRRAFRSLIVAAWETYRTTPTYARRLVFRGLRYMTEIWKRAAHKRRTLRTPSLNYNLSEPRTMTSNNGSTTWRMQLDFALLISQGR